MNLQDVLSEQANPDVVLQLNPDDFGIYSELIKAKQKQLKIAQEQQTAAQQAMPGLLSPTQQPQPKQNQEPTPLPILPQPSTLPESQPLNIPPPSGLPYMPRQQEKTPETVSDEISHKVMEATQGKPSSQDIVSGNRLETNVPIQVDKSGDSPNLIRMELLQNLGYAKMLWESAPGGEKGDVQRTNAEKIAAQTRQIAESLGIDLTQFGALTANAEDVYKHVDAQRAQDFINYYNGGKFSRSSADYYNDMVKGYIIEGHSRATAERLAANKAREYQANRRAYLSNMFQAYGKDSFYGVNNEGHRILGDLAQEDPVYADFLASRNQNSDLQYQNIAEENRTNSQKILELFKGHEFDLANIALRGLVEDSINRNNTTYQMGRDTHQGNIDIIKTRDMIEETANAELKKFKEQEAYKLLIKDHEPSEVEKIFKNLCTIGMMSGGSQEEVFKYATEMTVKHIHDKYSVKDKSSTDNGMKLSDKQQSLKNKIDNLYTAASASLNINDINALVRAIKGSSIPGDDNEGAIGLPPALYREYEAKLLALQGMERKMHNDDNAAYSFFRQVDPRTLEDLYPNYDWSVYFKEKGLDYKAYCDSIGHQIGGKS